MFVLLLTALPNALACECSCLESLMRTPGGFLIIQEFIMASKTEVSSKPFHLFLNTDVIYIMVFTRFGFLENRHQLGGEALELLFFHLCSIVTVI